MNRIGRFVTTAGIYFLGSTLSKILAFLLLPLYSSALNQADFGYFDLTTTIVTIVIGIISIEIWTGLIRFLLDQNSAHSKPEIVCNSLLVAAVSLLSLIPVYFLVSMFFEVPYLPLVTLYAGSYYMQALYGGLARGFQKNLDYAISGVLSSVINMLMNIIGLTLLGGGIEVLYISFFVSAISQVIYLEIKIHSLRMCRRENINWELLRLLVRFCLPLCTSSISFWALSNYGKIALTNSFGMSANAIYSMALRFASVIPLVTTVISLAWQETVFAGDDDEKQKKLYKKGINIYFNVLAFALILLMPVMKFGFQLIINDSYNEAVVLLPLCILFAVINGFSDFVGKIIISEGSTKNIFLSTTLGAVVCFFIATFLIPRFGIIMAPLSAVFGFLALLIVRLVKLYSINKVALPLKESIAVLFFVFVEFLIYYFGDSTLQIISFVFMLLPALYFSRDITKALLNFVKRR